MIKRPRRLRENKIIRSLVNETKLSADDFIYPIFIKENCQREEIKSLPGQFYLGDEELQREIEDLAQLGIKAIALFPVVENKDKTSDAKAAYQEDNFLNQTVSKTKANFTDEVCLVTDVALDPYTNHGHDGLLEDGKIINDKSVEVLTKMALSQAQAGADIVAPSDMMDGRVGAIREALERNDFHNTVIMSYTAKYASSLYGPFREALASLGSETIQATDTNLLEKTVAAPKDKKTYQMNFANQKEALSELEMDVAEGADIVMIKPASWYLDVINQFSQYSSAPVAAYQVSGEYAMIDSASRLGYLDRDLAIEESLLSIKRAGADIILSYFAKEFLAKQFA